MFTSIAIAFIGLVAITIACQIMTAVSDSIARRAIRKVRDAYRTK